ncbi:MAG: hypothetical protein HY701_02105 [Gemmatimonadetes bacterium]|nr:hypothetical protein [Gemmatimonadota bacterium]
MKPVLDARVAWYLAAAAVLMVVRPAVAQTDYYNTDAGRPILVEDAYAVERHALELQLAPVRLERQRGAVYHWGLEAVIAYGVLPRTQIEVGRPLAFVDEGVTGWSSGIAGIDLSVLHNLNVETSALPAFALAADLLLPVGSLGPDKAYVSVRGGLTRTFRAGRVHVNGGYTLGSEGERGGAVHRAAIGGEVLEVSRWMAGVAVDRTFPLSSLLVTADVYVRQPLQTDLDPEWNGEAGLRYQVSPRLALDAGFGRRLTGEDQAWFVTFGSAYAFALRSLIPVPQR